MRAHGLDQDDIEIGLNMIDGRERAVSLYDRKKIGSTLEDFVIIKMLG